MQNPNRKIDAFIFAGTPLAIDADFAKEMLVQYQHDLELLASGVPYSELGISKRREECVPSLIAISGDNIEVNSFTETNIQARSGQFAHLKLKGAMRMGDGLSSRGIDSLINDVRTANANPNISGILLEVNSGGGEALAGGALMNAIKDSRKPVVALVHRAGSAALRAILPAARRIGSGNDSQAGSIGSFVTIDRKFADWYNENYQDIYASQSPDKNRDFREMLNGSISSLQSSVNESAKIFQKDVKKYLNLSGDEAEVERTLSGGMFYAAEAKKRGLLDEIGTFETAVRALASEVRKANQSLSTKNNDMGLVSEIKALLNGYEEPKADSKEAAGNEPTPETPTEIPAVEAAETPDYSADIDALQNTVNELSGRLDTLTATVANIPAGLTAISEAVDSINESLNAISSRQDDLEKRTVEAGAKPAVKAGNRDIPKASETEKVFKRATAKLPERN